MLIVITTFSFDPMSTRWKKNKTIVTKHWNRMKSLLAEVHQQGLKCKVLIQKD